MGVTAYNEDEVQTALKLTDDQKAKIKTLIDDYNKDRGELMPQRGAGGGGGNFQEILPKLEALAKTYTEKVQAVLTDEQKKAWKDLVGAEFNLQARRPAADR